MSDYIKREDLIDKIEITPFEDYGDYLKVIEEIKESPSAEVIEPKRGEWINKHEWENGFFERECSVCGAMKPILMHTAKINFCPNCGARMKGADDE